MPGRETLQAWLQVQCAVEMSLQSSIPLAGMATDMIKAFNCIQRPQWFTLATHCGFPNRILGPWRIFLANFSRRFQVNNHLSSPLWSTVGFAEGDPLSVSAMALLDWSLHLYQEQLAPKIRTISFVDNVSLVSRDVGLLLQGFFSLQAFLHLWGLTIDVKKSYIWSTSPQWRRILASFGMKIVEDAAELGGSLSLCASSRVRIFLARGHKLEQKWQRLRISKAPLKQKLIVLPMVFWSAALHGALGSIFADSHIHELRKKAISVLRLRIGGSNPLLRFGLSEPLTADPGFFQLRSCVFDFRRICRKTPEVLQLWKIYMARFNGDKTFGPFFKLVSLFSMIGWHFEQVPCFRDHDGIVYDLLCISNGALDALLREGWLQWVSTQVNHRLTMQDLNGIDLPLAFLDRSQLTPGDLGRVLALQTGAFISAKQHAKYDPAKCANCSICGGLQGLLAGTWLHIGTNVENHDLWEHLSQLLEQLPHGRLQAFWVPSHLELQRCETSVEEWLCSWNNTVDAFAVSVNAHRDDVFTSTLQEAISHHEAWKHRLQLLRGFYLQVHEAGTSTALCIDLTNAQSSEELAQLVDDVSVSEALPIDWRQQLAHCFSDDVVTSYVVQIFERIFRLETISEQFFQISFIELALWFVHTQGLPILFGDAGSGWIVRDYHSILMKPTVASVVHTIRKLLCQALQFLGLGCFIQKAMQRSEAGIGFSTDGLIICCCTDLASECTDAVRPFAGQRQLRKAADLARPY
eukprot:Skav235992  [mRNA]  locus=scaffold348:200764:203450:- [translate_table: standard]